MRKVADYPAVVLQALARRVFLATLVLASHDSTVVAHADHSAYDALLRYMAHTRTREFCRVRRDFYNALSVADLGHGRHLASGQTLPGKRRPENMGHCCDAGNNTSVYGLPVPLSWHSGIVIERIRMAFTGRYGPPRSLPIDPDHRKLVGPLTLPFRA
jgi:hypothetical protein